MQYLGTIDKAKDIINKDFVEKLLGNYQPLISESSKLAYSLISGVPTSLPASDVYSWAKAANKPSYTWSEITSKPTWIGSSKPTYSYSEITGAISTTELQNYLTQNSYLNVTSGDNRYLQLSGGTLSSDSRSPLTLKSGSSENHSLLLFNRGSDYWGSIGFNAANSLIFKDTNGANYTIWHSGNDGSGSGLDADTLDGLHNGELTAKELVRVSGGVLDANTLVNPDSKLKFYSTIASTSSNIPTYNGYQNALLEIPLHSNGVTSQFYFTYGKNPYYRAGVDKSWNEIAYKTDNVSSATKLQTARTIWGQSFDGTGNVSGVISNTSTIMFDTSLGATNIGYLWTNTRGMHMDMSGLGTEQQGTNLTLTPSGNVGIGTASPQQKLHVEGNIWANGDIAAKTKIQSFGDLIVNGNVGIGTPSPSAIFHVIGTIYKTCIFDSTYTAYGYNYGSIHLSLNGESKGVIGVNTVPSSKGSSNTAGTYIENVVSGEWMNFYNEGGLFLKANLLVNGGITMYSDQRKKTILNHVELSLKQIAEAPLIEHYYNGDDKKTTHVGSIAQYWASMNDWFCKLDSEGYYTMEIQNAALASAISIARELDRYETKTDKAIKMLKQRICELEEEVERLKSA